MRKVSYSTQFKKDFKRIIKRGFKIKSIYIVMKKLEHGENLGQDYKEHSLVGKYEGYLECHIGPDWLLIYKTHEDHLYFARTGTHADLF